MQHVDQLSQTDALPTDGLGRDVLRKAMGQFYTPGLIAEHAASLLLDRLPFHRLGEIDVVDPFCGDGRLIVALLENAASRGLGTSEGFLWNVALWDYDAEAVPGAVCAVHDAAARLSLNVSVEVGWRVWDSLLESEGEFDRFDCVFTNPPWETIKPDSRELHSMEAEEREVYVSHLRDYDQELAHHLPLSQPARKFAGWGTNLSRCGLELSIRLLAEGGLCGIVLPLPVMMDQNSRALREWMLTETTLRAVTSYPAGARLFDGVDQDAVVLLLEKTPAADLQPTGDAGEGYEGPATVVERFTSDSGCYEREVLHLHDKLDTLSGVDYSLPVAFGATTLRMLERWEHLPTMRDLEQRGELWLGRELDETRYREWLTDEGRFQFIKGRMIGRYRIVEAPTEFVDETRKEVPATAEHLRIAWRDVARRSQARRMHATLVDAGVVTGNSLHVARLVDDDILRLRALLVLMNSLPFEFQVRAQLGTGHISLGVVRQVRVPELDRDQLVALARALEAMEDDEAGLDEAGLEVLAARAYDLDQDGLADLLRHFDRLDEAYVRRVLDHPLWAQERSSRRKGRRTSLDVQRDGIPNHVAPSLSDLDLRMARAVPPGGNWKDIPEDIPSKRVQQIRESYARGGGSRSTYYGRLHPERPSYTINTNFNRPGNGCHLHYDYDGGQHRVLSHREAARLQSFPDGFVFQGSRSAIETQIGNAVPPLLAYQIARSLPFGGQYVDLFSGAGGLSLGLRWAGWEPLVANDVKDVFLETYAENVHDNVVAGDLRDEGVFKEVIERARAARTPGVPLWVVGGPPCQGFSTAGNRRTMRDERNWLFDDYRRVIEALEPDGFLFENVTGLKNMSGGRVLAYIQRAFEEVSASLTTWYLQAERYAVPQRRTRLFMVGLRKGAGESLPPPEPTTHFGEAALLFDQSPPAVSVSEALDDLPALEPGEDGQRLPYAAEPYHPYQSLMRGRFTPDEYLDALRYLEEVRRACRNRR